MSDKIHLFIDTNVLLSFYAFTNDDLEELKKITALVKNDKLTLYFNKVVRSEFWRNRESKLAETLRGFDVSVIRSLPRFVESYSEALEFRNLLSKAEKLRKQILEKARSDSVNVRLIADTLIEDIIGVSTFIDLDPQVTAKA